MLLRETKEEENKEERFVITVRAARLSMKFLNSAFTNETTDGDTRRR